MLTATQIGGIAPFNFHWSNGDSTMNTTDTVNFTVTGLSAGTYTVTVTDSNGSTATASATITQPTNLTAGSISADSLVTLSLDTFCFNTVETIYSLTEASGSLGTSAYVYLWQVSPNGTNWITAPAPNTNASYAVQGIMSETYFRRQVSVPACNEMQTSNSVRVHVNNEISVFISTLNASCEGVKDGAVSSTPVGGTGSLLSVWSTGDTTTTLPKCFPGVYTVTVTDEFGCSVVESDTVHATHPAPVFSFGSDTFFLAMGFATVSAPEGFAHYVWSNGGNTPTVEVENEGLIWCTVEDANGCKKSDTVWVYLVIGIDEHAQRVAVMVYPNPAKDMVSVKADNGTLPQRITLRDMSGKLVTETRNATNIDLRGMASGTYLLEVQFEGSSPFSRTVVVE